MNAIPFDTHEFVETLSEAGIPREQAIAHKNALRKAAFATSADIDQLRLEMREMEQRIKLDMIKWMVGIAIAQTAAVVGLIGALLNIV
uniref:DUF1640 domain-containing protein n=1 Tax=Candidatus Kentrum sp. FM TaxID=2126340 RepID=A0A450TPE1_9GAMM|nr:MAG: hypothetical protein BECKFM1743C_GA0114222_105341 [Candidatus Kentron sp. FM]VFJ70540.1 MAG: hypothetical protein BECKFM1743A_GA0114220_105531 [Candidatus Kentron sp. FM]VFK18047.1 MAG: hypothetical protein BECKFM1743B_GA0114221_105211 [Candidatus Kentron sp. FM]